MDIEEEEGGQLVEKEFLDSLVGMALDEAIESLPEDVCISISPQSNFVFIGTKAEWQRDKEWVRQCEKDKRDKAKLARINDLSKKFNAIITRLKLGRFGISDMELGDIRNLVDKVTAADDYCKSFRPFGERRILEAWNRIREGDGINILVDGDEDGDYWLRSEYIKTREKAKQSNSKSGAQSAGREEKKREARAAAGNADKETTWRN